ncbi:sirohydrochlorin cobaltochelatase [Xenorhabdus nematophila]|uniref:Sirohydrochlorin cobaltochelatase n=1 Tax=Xenorhabdus nematophila (strain ATCC 19061 / DSM 3370 / CCUG 14189 / LMG 1036 / NCIMB 9965 / AN6) TaxID=406817 RepID=D3V932_XENNA|nr:sirohydrochlorin cobaltochelatase [Xenorhabdus nematophila]CEE93993.1 Sirohydrochlorin cobaltochelatase [Xenorhabdus nematophila str. Anatoliense]CEF30758.1 Sirohydrochlorin cobaltochelatase [Xenorhabdus nematophila str. Websteri]AYA40814.1 sirohydrochlorin cobaltochelatase [Xenorhabdus nematophila]KHD28627.1 sirohydrochlorin cobaltochelatase [Xenorhabdus nematophila]MBA0019564.1 sirohydrochlorin cobaltochelatase [Xenorhabdus nematophila]
MKKALLVISFGTSYPETRRNNIEACEQQLASVFPDRELFRAFTSGMIIRKLRQRDGIHVDTPHEALTRLHHAGYHDVAVQCLHIIKGDEYEKVLDEVEKFRPCFKRLVLGEPLLSQFDDYVQLMRALRHQLPRLAENECVVFMGHGTTHHAFSAYACLDHLMSHYYFPARVGAVESYPELPLLIKGLKEKGIRKVHLMPLMLVAGDHAINDMASNEKGSWKYQLEKAGITAIPWLQGLGENSMIRQMFVDHLTQALGNEEKVW